MKISSGRVVSMKARPSKRILALVIDYFLVTIAFLGPLVRLFGSASTASSTFALVQSASPGLVLYVSSAMSLVIILYFALFESAFGKTPGMQLTGLSTQSTFFQSVLRNIFLLPLFPFIILLPVEIYRIIARKELLMEHFTNTTTTEQVTV